MTSCSTVILAAESILLISHSSHRDFLKRFARNITSKWWLSAWNFTKKTFKTCQLSENRLGTCWPKSEHSNSEKKQQTNARFMDSAFKKKGH